MPSHAWVGFGGSAGNGRSWSEWQPHDNKIKQPLSLPHFFALASSDASDDAAAAPAGHVRSLSRDGATCIPEYMDDFGLFFLRPPEFPTNWKEGQKGPRKEAG